MALGLLSVFERSPTRIRLIFDGALASGAFVATSYLAAESLDGSMTPTRTWSVTGAIAIASNSAAIELVLSSPMTEGSWAWVSFLTLVPAVSGGPFVGATSPQIRSSEPLPPPSPEVSQTDFDAVLWGEDLFFDGGDWRESPEGDLAVISGPANAEGAIVRRMLSEGLTWDQSYGLRPRRYIDAPAVTARAILGEAQAQAVADDRIAQAASTLGPVDPTVPDAITIETALTFFTGNTSTVSASPGS